MQCSPAFIRKTSRFPQAPNRLTQRYRRVMEAVMNRTTLDDVVFETTATCAVLVAGTALAALLYQLITLAVPLLESMVFPQVLANVEIFTGYYKNVSLPPTRLNPEAA